MAKTLRLSPEALAAYNLRQAGFGLGKPVDKKFVKRVEKDAAVVAGKLCEAIDKAVVDRYLRAANGEIEAMFEVQLLELDLHRTPAFQYRPLPDRKFLLDVAFPRVKVEQSPIAFECQGNVHRIKAQFKRDMERHNLLTRAGWTMYYMSGDMIRDGRAAKFVKEVIG